MLASIAYLDNAILEVEFCRGTVYRYLNVPRSVFDALLRADSVGRYFNQFVRHHFRSTRVA
jgi:hypothetical protein